MTSILIISLVHLFIARRHHAGFPRFELLSCSSLTHHLILLSAASNDKHHSSDSALNVGTISHIYFSFLSTPYNIYTAEKFLHGIYLINRFV